MASPRVSASSRGLPTHKIHTIHNSVVTADLERLASQDTGIAWFSSNDVPVILAVGRLAPQKDFLTLLQAFALLRARVRARLVILGEGVGRQRLEKRVAELGLSGHVLMPGFHPNPYACMARARVFVLSSAYEGFPNVLVEALACGANIVATDCRSGPAEILDNGRFGRLVPVGDASSMAHALEDALNDSGFRRERSRLRALDFSTSRAAQAYLDLLFPGEWA